MRSSSINISLWTTVLFVLLVTQFLITIESKTTGPSNYGTVRNALHNRDKSNEDEDRIIFRDDDSNEEAVHNVKNEVPNAVDGVSSDTIDHRNIIVVPGQPVRECPIGQAKALGLCRPILPNFSSGEEPSSSAPGSN